MTSGRHSIQIHLGNVHCQTKTPLLYDIIPYRTTLHSHQNTIANIDRLEIKGNKRIYIYILLLFPSNKILTYFSDRLELQRSEFSLHLWRRVLKLNEGLSNLQFQFSWGLRQNLSLCRHFRSRMLVYSLALLLSLAATVQPDCKLTITLTIRTA